MLDDFTLEKNSDPIILYRIKNNDIFSNKFEVLKPLPLNQNMINAFLLYNSVKHLVNSNKHQKFNLIQPIYTKKKF